LDANTDIIACIEFGVKVTLETTLGNVLPKEVIGVSSDIKCTKAKGYCIAGVVVTEATKAG